MSEHELKARLEQAEAWARGEWIKISEDVVPAKPGHYELLSDRGACWAEYQGPGQSVNATIAWCCNWKRFCEVARERGFYYIWSEPALLASDLPKPKE